MIDDGMEEEKMKMLEPRSMEKGFPRTEAQTSTERSCLTGAGWCLRSSEGVPCRGRILKKHMPK